MKKILNRVKKSKFLKNVLVMVTGAAGAQAVVMLASPLITRLYGPEAFGLLGTFTSITKVIIPIAALTYPVAIVLPKKDQEAKGIIKLSLIISTIFSILVLVSLLLFNDRIAELLNLQEISSFTYLIPAVIIFGGLVQVTEQWLIRTNQFSINAKVNFFQSVINNASKVGFGFFYAYASVLVILQVMAEGLKAAMLITLSRKSKFNNTYVQPEETTSLNKLAKKYYDFPLYRMPEKFFSSFSQSLPILLLTSLFGPASAGFYNIGKTVLAMPSKLIGQAIGDVFYPRISEAANNQEDLNKLIKKATLALIGIGVIPFGLIFLFGPPLFEFVFGDGWNVAGEYAKWISLVSFSTFINKPSTKSMPVMSAQRFHLFFTIGRLITQSLGLIIGFLLFHDDVLAIALFGSTGFILNLWFIFFTLKLARKHK